MIFFICFMPCVCLRAAYHLGSLGDIAAVLEQHQLIIALVILFVLRLRVLRALIDVIVILGVEESLRSDGAATGCRSCRHGVHLPTEKVELQAGTLTERGNGFTSVLLGSGAVVYEEIRGVVVDK